MAKKTRPLLYISLVIIFFAQPVVAATFSAGDAEFTFSASLRYEASYQFIDKGDLPPSFEDSEIDWHMKMPSTSRLTLSSRLHDMTAFVQLGLIDTGADLSDDTYLRHAYFTYEMDDKNSLLIGQTWSLLADSPPIMQRLNLDIGLWGSGDLYSGRNPQIRYTHKTDELTWSLAIEDNDTTISGLSSSYVTNEITPAFLGRLEWDNDNGLKVSPSFLVQQYELKSNDYASFDLDGDGTSETILPLKDIDVIAWALAVVAGYRSDDFTWDIELWYGNNVGIFASAFDLRPTAQKTTVFGAPAVKPNHRDIKDASSMGGWFQVGFPLDEGTIYTGLGYQESEVKNYPSYLYESDISIWAVFASYKYFITDNFLVQPCITYFNHGDDALKIREYTNNIYYGNDLGDDLYIGCMFQYDF